VNIQHLDTLVGPIPQEYIDLHNLLTSTFDKLSIKDCTYSDNNIKIVNVTDNHIKRFEITYKNAKPFVIDYDGSSIANIILDSYCKSITTLYLICPPWEVN
jgi:hypothetical protein